MAKHGRKRTNYGSKGLVHRRNFTFGLSTLANDTVVFETSPVTLAQDCSFNTYDVYVSWEGATAGEGPIEIGIAGADLTVTEVEEALEAQPTSQFDFPAIEHQTRPVRSIVVLPFDSEDGISNDGKPIRRKMRMQVPAGKTIPRIWALNRSGGTLTTGSVIAISAKYYGSWQ